MLLRELADARSAAHVPYCVVGGVAVNLHGAHRETYDLDIVVPPDEPSLAALAKVLAKLGLRSSERIALAKLADARTRRELVLERNRVSLGFSRGSETVTLVLAPPIAPAVLVRRAVVRKVDGARVRVAALPDLVCMKRVSGRLLDAIDVARLERRGKQ